MKIMIFQTEAHVRIEFVAQASECLVSKNRVRIRTMHRSVANLDPIGIDDREGGANAAPDIRDQLISMGALKADVEEQRHIGKLGIDSGGASAGIYPVSLPIGPRRKIVNQIISGV